jgi:hypothetical protein
LVFSPQTHAELVSIETNTLLLSYNTEDLFNTGNLELLGNRLLFQPNLGVSVNSQTFDYSPPPRVINKSGVQADLKKGGALC